MSALTLLDSLDFDNNENIQGEIPDSLGSLQALRFLDINTNRLTGSLPNALCNASSLERIDVQKNSMEGAIPSCIGTLNSLQVLALDENGFIGTIPTNFGQLDSLRKFSFFIDFFLYNPMKSIHFQAFLTSLTYFFRIPHSQHE